MYIQALELKNFRKFDERRFAFHPKFTVIVGDNATGKTQILDALAVILGTFQSQLLRSRNSVRDIRKEEVRTVVHSWGETEVREEEQYPVSVSSNGLYQGKEYHIQRVKKSFSGRTTYGRTNPLFAVLTHQALNVQQGLDETLPLLAYYGTGRAQHLKRHPKSGNAPNSRRDGYKDSLDPNADLKAIKEWLRRQYLIALQGKSETRALRFLNEALGVLIPGCQRISYDVATYKIFLDLSSGEKCLFSNLSDGFRCMTYMLTDMIRRIVLQNPHFTSLEQANGVVLVDELDLFLHPRWQRTVVPSLLQIFPNVQFIVTTHSPFIVQSLQPGMVLDLESEQETVQDGWASPAPTGAYVGQGIEDIAENVMEVPNPQWSVQRMRLFRATKDFFALLQDPLASPEEINRKKRELDILSIPFNENLAFSAFVEVAGPILSGETHETDR